MLQNISFTHQKDVLGIAGSNGSGKSTLMKCFAGLSRPTKGNLKWLTGEQPLEWMDFKRSLGYAAPYINLYSELTCYENLRFLLKLRNAAVIKESILNALEQTEMGLFSAQTFGSLSTGQQQRMRIAAAIVHQPYVLFLDEPGSNLDKTGREVIQSVVTEFKADRKLVIIASNNRNELKMCDKIYSVEEERFKVTKF